MRIIAHAVYSRKGIVAHIKYAYAIKGKSMVISSYIHIDPHMHVYRAVIPPRRKRERIKTHTGNTYSINIPY
jgi:hypothetical protein